MSDERNNEPYLISDTALAGEISKISQEISLLILNSECKPRIAVMALADNLGAIIADTVTKENRLDILESVVQIIKHVMVSYDEYKLKEELLKIALSKK